MFKVSKLDLSVENIHGRTRTPSPIKSIRCLRNNEDFTQRSPQLSTAKQAIRELEQYNIQGDKTIRHLSSQLVQNCENEMTRSEFCQLRDIISESSHKLNQKEQTFRNLSNELLQTRSKVTRNRNSAHELELETEGLVEIEQRKAQKACTEYELLVQKLEEEPFLLKSRINIEQDSSEELQIKLTHFKNCFEQLRDENQQLQIQIKEGEIALNAIELKKRALEKSLNGHETLQREQSWQIVDLQKQIAAEAFSKETALLAKNREIDTLKKQMRRSEDEIRDLVAEIEKQKQLAKENMEKLNQMLK